MLKYAKALVARAKVYYITGNHERRLENFDELMDELSKVGFIVLLNRVSVYYDKGFEIDFLGLDENQANFDDYKARKKAPLNIRICRRTLSNLMNSEDIK